MASPSSSFALTSPAFTTGGWIPSLHTGEGLNLSPPLRWQGAPEKSHSFTLTLTDPDAPEGTWVHWVLFDIPASIQALPAGLARHPKLPNGARHGRCWGTTNGQRVGYQGPQPPRGSAHRYQFKLQALDCGLGLPEGSSLAAVEEAMAGHVLASTTLTGFYGTDAHRGDTPSSTATAK